MSTDILKIVLIVSTVNRKEPLVRLLDSLVLQTYPHFTVLIGDQNHPSYLEKVLKRYENRLDINYHPIQKQSLSSARNTLLPHMQGDIFALTDDDCLYLPDTLERVVHIFQMHEIVSTLIGCPSYVQSRPFFKAENRYTVFRRAPSWLLFFRAEVARAVGDFDTNLGIGAPTPFQSGEETDYLLRAMCLGFKIYRSSDVFVWHPLLEGKNANIAKARGYAYGRMELLRKHAFPLWFKILNVLIPVCSPGFFSAHKYRSAVFFARLHGLLCRRPWSSPKKNRQL